MCKKYLAERNRNTKQCIQEHNKRHRRTLSNFNKNLHIRADQISIQRQHRVYRAKKQIICVQKSTHQNCKKGLEIQKLTQSIQHESQFLVDDVHALSVLFYDVEIDTQQFLDL